MPKKITADLEACKTCRVGSCCYEGVELTSEELKRIVASDPPIEKPWFSVLTGKERSDAEHPFATVVRNGTCVFQDKNNRCTIYAIRPQYCRDFPLEDRTTALHYQRLCVLFHEQWPHNSSVRRTFDQRENTLKKD